VAKAREEGVPYREDVYVTKLLKSGGRINGAAGLDLRSGRGLVFGARAVVLAAGGYTSIYRRGSSRPDENNGDAMALAYEAGAALKDMEFVQFHPTGMIEPEEMEGRLVTEAVRGEGGRLYNADSERFMERYSPEHMELDARDVVARANYREIQEGRGTPDGAVLLDISHRDSEYVRERLPNMYEQFMEQGVDITKDPMKVSPTAHYGMGGIEVDPRNCATAVEGLYAVGESAAGVHGANRLGGNSLAETVVFGKVLGEHLVDDLDGLPSVPIDRAAAREHLAALDALAAGTSSEEAEGLIEELRDLVWNHAGIVRTGDGLREGIEGLRRLPGSLGSGARARPQPARHAGRGGGRHARRPAPRGVARRPPPRGLPRRIGRVAEEHPLRQERRWRHAPVDRARGQGAGEDTEGPRRGLQPRLPLPRVGTSKNPRGRLP
jgi:succinate dehydrogenase / fumarate reductase flavoprotein subunit